MQNETAKTTHRIEVRFGKLHERHWHIKTYSILAENRDAARKLARRMAKGWASNPMNRVRSGAFNVRS